jgi:hypothetical protein
MGGLIWETFMKAESYANLLGQLADALKRWVDKLSVDLYDESKFDRWFSACVYDARLKLLVRLGAERSGYLAELIDTTLNQVKEQGKKFTGATGRSLVIRDTPASALMEFSRVDDTRDSSWATEDMREQMIRCDRLFAAVDQAIHQTDPLTSGDDDRYTNRFETDGYLPKNLRKKLAGISDTTLKKYAKKVRQSEADQRRTQFPFPPGGLRIDMPVHSLRRTRYRDC